MSTCRFCKDWKEGKYGLVKYGVRHYAHADCGLKAKGSGFFDLLSDWQLEQFPFFAAKDAGLDVSLSEKIRGRHEHTR